jgi:hypothetical protein
VTLLDWLTAGDVADYEIEQEEAVEWFREVMAQGNTGGLIGRTSRGSGRGRRRRRWSRARVLKALQRWLTLLAPFAALAAALLGLFRKV